MTMMTILNIITLVFGCQIQNGYLKWFRAGVYVKRFLHWRDGVYRVRCGEVFTGTAGVEWRRSAFQYIFLL